MKILVVIALLLTGTLHSQEAFAAGNKGTVYRRHKASMRVFTSQDSAMEQYLKVVEKTDSPFGVLEFLHWNHPWNNYKYSSQKDLAMAVGLMLEAGISFVRMDFLWGDIEPKPGEFDFDKYDYIVEFLCKHGIHILGILNYCAPWASPTGEWNHPPADNTLFVNYASKVIERYKYKVQYWEIWNEPDSYTYWEPQDGLKSYTVLLKEVYTAAKKIYPECVILNGGLASGLASINHLYDNGAGDYFDILNLHIFQAPVDSPDALKSVAVYPELAHKIMVRNGDRDKKIWITEIGCPGVPKGAKVANWWLGGNPDELQQAQWVEKVYTELLKIEYVKKIFWAFLRDTKEHWHNGIDYFGLVRWDFSRKPSFLSYRAVVKNWRQAHSGDAGRPQDTPDTPRK